VLLTCSLSKATERRLGSKIEEKFRTFNHPPPVKIRGEMAKLKMTAICFKLIRTQSLIYFGHGRRVASRKIRSQVKKIAQQQKRPSTSVGRPIIRPASPTDRIFMKILRAVGKENLLNFRNHPPLDPDP